MPWSDNEAREVLDAYWKQGGATCPSCKEAHVRFDHKPISEGYYLFANCPRGCDGVRMDRSCDPQAASFRAWTTEEQDAVIANHFSERPTTCPVDGTRVDVNEQAYFGGRTVFVNCPRCGVSFSRSFPQG